MWFKYPYTSYSELNLDWFLSQFKELLEAWDAQKVDYEQFKLDVTTEFNTLSGKFDDLKDAFDDLYDYVHDYFDDLDVQQEVNNKLNEMASDGSLTALIQPLFDEYKEDIDEEVDVQNNRITVLEGRMDTFSSLTEGSTSGDAELMDIRVGYDGETYVTAGDAVRGQISEIYDVIDDFAEDTFSPISGTSTTGKFINYNAVVTNANSSYYITEYAVSAEDRFDISGAAGSGGYVYIFVDSSNNTLSKSAKNTTSGILNYDHVIAKAPTGSVKLIVSSNISSSCTQVSVLKSDGYVIPDLVAAEGKIDIIDDVIGQRTVTEEVPSTDYTIIDDHYMFNTGILSAESPLWHIAEYAIPSNVTGFIVSAYCGGSARLWVLKDAGGTALAGSADSSGVSLKTEHINLADYPTAATLYVNDRKSGELKINKQYPVAKIDAENVFFGETPLENMSKLQGKILCCAGDSITYGADMDADGITDVSSVTVYQSDSDGYFTEVQGNFLKTWGFQIANRNNMTFYNAGVSGSTMQGISERNGFSCTDGRYTKLPDDIDYLLIWFGWNDNAYGTLGTINDNDNTTFYGSYNVVMPYLINKYPYTKIALIVPFGSSVGHREAVRQIGNKWGVAVWDNYYGGTPLYYGKEDSVGVEASIVTSNRSKFQANGAHPNYKGHKQLADMIEQFIKGI